jgi:hypothetical protein
MKKGRGRRKERKLGDDGERIGKIKMTRIGRKMMMQQLLSPENR